MNARTLPDDIGGLGPKVERPIVKPASAAPKAVDGKPWLIEDAAGRWSTQIPVPAWDIALTKAAIVFLAEHHRKAQTGRFAP